MKKRGLSRSTIILLTCLLAVPTVPELAFGANVMGDFARLKPYLLAGLILGAAHLLLRPVLRLITAPMGCVTLGLSGVAIDVGLIYLASGLVDGLAKPEFLCALLTAMVINGVCGVFAR